MSSEAPSTPIVVRTDIDAQRTWWFDSFFDEWAVQSPHEIVAAVSSASLRLNDLVDSPDLVLRGLTGRTYWRIYVKGYSEFLEFRAVTPDNSLFEYLHERGGARRHDPGLLGELRTEDAIADRVARRFADFDLFFASGGREDPVYPAAPISCVVNHGAWTVEGERWHWPLYRLGSRTPTEVLALDGWHRLFLARLFGIAAVPCDFHFRG